MAMLQFQKIRAWMREHPQWVLVLQHLFVVIVTSLALFMFVALITRGVTPDAVLALNQVLEMDGGAPLLGLMVVVPMFMYIIAMDLLKFVSAIFKTR